MIKHESAFDLFQRLNVKDGQQQSEIFIDRLNRYYEILFPNGLNNRCQLIELLDNNRIKTKKFLHGFISDYIAYMNYRNNLLNLPFQTENIILSSPQANKDSVESDIPTLEMKFNHEHSIMFLYIDTEYKECPFNKSQFIQWYDCQTSSEILATLFRFEQSYFIPNPNQQCIIIIDSNTQVPINDYYKTTTSTDVMSIEENKLLTIQWHTVLCYFMNKYKLSCIIVEHLDIETPILDTIISKRDNRTMRRNSKNKEFNIPYSEFAFGRLMNCEHYTMINQFEYRQIHGNDMINFRYESQSLSDSMSPFKDLIEHLS